MGIAEGDVVSGEDFVGLHLAAVDDDIAATIEAGIPIIGLGAVGIQAISVGLTS